jgi:tetratricopeptide (TPR) repeat protein
VLAQEAADVELQLMVLKTEYAIARRSGEPYRQLKIVHKAYDLARFGVNPSVVEADWLQIEAFVNIYIGNLPRALNLCRRVGGVLISNGMQRFNRGLTLFDCRAEIHFRKIEYLEARRHLEQIVSKTSVMSSCRYGANSLVSMAYLDILTEGPVADILANIRAAEAIWESLSLSKVLLCSFVTTELQLYRGDQSECARGAFLQYLANIRGLYPDLQRLCFMSLGEPRHRIHNSAGMFHWAVISIGFVQKMKEPVGTLKALRRLADVHNTLRDDDTALQLFRAALEGGD